MNHEQEQQILDQIADREALSAAYAKVFDDSNPHVKIILDDIIENCFILKPTFVPNDPHATAHNEGARNFAISLLTRIYKDPTKQLKLLKGKLNNA
jgi:hypothetical protein